MRAAYGEGSQQLAHQRLKLSAVLRTSGEHAEAQQEAALAEEVLRVIEDPGKRKKKIARRPAILGLG